MRSGLAFISASLAVGLSLVVFAITFVFAGGTTDLPWSVSGSSGNFATSTGHELGSTSGQSVIGGSSTLCAGFWCRALLVTQTPTVTPTDTPTATPTPSPTPTDTGNTPVGSPVPVDLGQGVIVTFDEVKTAGNTELMVSSMGPPPPTGFRLGTPPVYYDISTTATFNGNVEVCINYDDSSIPPPMEMSLMLFHRVDSAWVEATTSLDTVNDIICAEVTSFSEFLPVALIPDEDFDGDGCLNEAELQTAFGSQLTGGMRDPFNQWDFYDVAGANQGPPDRQVDLFNDIVSVIEHYAPTGLEPEYDVWYDRGPSAGPNPWNMTAPDGKIDLFNDIVGVINQFGHDCR